eukprot:CAMPEP_0177203990 /NCGR_PEP_ID=MMETSP0367-20130122/28107_1 /TAXON_ID=447022 ORGANISM="Scrippsiella hangoei-like, Strain SHHI-4" /NCGR_SAMPLE_ID=MMETSP0367 /ASSEMBLY_ACC=CAM_ASM_000362 /LENGTH=315 /DNA_ID=CAMNT_0018652653 /DNA_START=81 /DNA_END=1028 /DNA_ORIENTATION=+
MSRNLWVAAQVLFVALRPSAGSDAAPTSQSHMAATRRLEAIASIAELEADATDASCRLLQVDAREASKASKRSAQNTFAAREQKNEVEEVNRTAADQKASKRSAQNTFAAREQKNEVEQVNRTAAGQKAASAQRVSVAAAAVAGALQARKASMGLDQAISLVITDALPDPDAPASPPKKKKSKVILMLLEMVPVCGPIGLDRFYLGSTKTGLAKLTVCLCTCLVGGLVWGLIDAIIVILNSLSRKQSINSLGLEAEFDEDETEPAFYLACIAVVVQILCLCFCTGWRYMGSKQAPKEDTVIIGAPAGARLISSAR